jgi:hypothetical protein
VSPTAESDRAIDDFDEHTHIRPRFPRELSEVIRRRGLLHLFPGQIPQANCRVPQRCSVPSNRAVDQACPLVPQRSSTVLR